MLRITERAVSELQRTLADHEDPRLRLRVFINHQCKCGTVRFAMELEREVRSGDREFDVVGIPFVADERTFPELPAAEVGYVDDFMVRGFTVRNVNHDCSGHR